METNKYYTPTIEEFHVGFRFEVLNNGIWDWQNMNASRLQEINFDDNLNNMSKYRVKYLDKSDIESLGFNIKSESHPWFKAVNNSGPDAMYFNKFIDKMELILFYSIEINKLEIHIQVPCNKDYTTYQSIFIGTIKNKSELIKLLKMLNINAQSH
jgi:hypothetical protein